MGKLLYAIITPLAIPYFTLKRFITGKPEMALKYAAELLEEGLNTQITEISISTDKGHDGHIYFFFRKNFILHNPDIKKISKHLQISEECLKIVKWEDKRIVLGISTLGMNQLNNRIKTLPNIWKRISNNCTP